METPSSFPVFTNTTCNDASKLNNAFESSFVQVTPCSGTSGYLQKLSVSSLVDSKIYDNGTNIGIGTTTPDHFFQIRRAGGAGSLGITIDNYLGITNRDVKFFVVPDTSSDVGGYAFIVHSGVSGDVTALSISAGGKVSIGTTNFTSPLTVAGCEIYSSNASALAAGLTAGAHYRTGGDPDVVCIVHS